MINFERYDRQIRLKSFGSKAQEKLVSARILVIGAGGLGCPALQYLTAAGIGTIGIVDDDKVALSNLHRQILYSSDQIGSLKTEAAAERLKTMNPEIEINIISERITTQNAIAILSNYDLILDCTDNFPTRYLLDDACRILEKPLVFAAIYQFEGQVAIFNVCGKDKFTTHYRNLFPDPPQPGEVPDCNDAGVLGILPGIIGTIQAAEAIKLLTGIGEPLANRLMTLNILDYQTAIFEIPAENLKNRNIPYTKAELEQMDYEVHCGMVHSGITYISPSEFHKIAQFPDTVVIDVREEEEFPKLDLPYLSIPLTQLSEQINQISQKNIVVVCQSGKRSITAARILFESLGRNYKISHLEGGINNLNNQV